MTYKNSFLVSVSIFFCAQAFATPQSFTAECGLGQPIISGTIDIPQTKDFALTPVADGTDLAIFEGYQDDCPDSRRNGEMIPVYAAYSATGCSMAQTVKPFAAVIGSSTYASPSSAWPKTATANPTSSPSAAFPVCASPLKALAGTWTTDMPGADSCDDVNWKSLSGKKLIAIDAAGGDDDTVKPSYALKASFEQTGMGAFANLAKPLTIDLIDSYGSHLTLYFQILNSGELMPTRLATKNPTMNCNIKMGS
jgi:hypothetical protein